MSWQHRLPRDISGFRQSADGFEFSVSIPADEEGFFGRTCPDCDRFFKMRVEQWDALPDEARVTCPYCGHQPDDVHDFLTAQQNARLESALEAAVEQYLHQAVSKMFQGFGTRRLRPGESGIEIRVSHDPPPPVRSITAYAEEEVRRTITCERCATVYAVYGATAFCPVCGPRAAADTVLESIERARRALALEDALPEDLREQARADGVFDRAAADTIKEVVTLFEVFARDQFAAHVADHENVVKQKGRGVFQRLDDADALFAEHLGATIAATVTKDAWEHLQVVFQQRHVLIHKHGIVDEEYLRRVPTAPQKVGQRLVLARSDAEQALDALEAVVRAVATLS